MLTRLRWFGLGAVAGSLATVYGLHRLREARQSVVSPDKVIDTVGGALRVGASTARETWDEARLAMAEVDAELRAGRADPAPVAARAGRHDR